MATPTYVTYIADYYTYVMIIVGLLGFLLGIDRILKKREEENKVLQALSFIGGLLMLAVPILLIYYIDTPGVYSNYTILLMLITGLSLNSRPFEKIPAAFAFVIIIAMGIIYMVWNLRTNKGIGGDIPIELVAVIIGGIVLVLFLLSYAFEQIMDVFLYMMGWGVFVGLVSALTLAQGVAIIVLKNHYGLLTYLGFS